jgi:hypothetical protein
MSELPKPGEDTFTAADLEPSDAEKNARRRAIAEKAAATVAVMALGLWFGGMIALGACAAPFVFEMTPYPWSGKAMGAAFQRFDGIAMGCAVVVLGCEVVRTLLTLRRRDGVWIARIRRYLAILAAGCAIYGGMILSPRIVRMHEEGVRRNVGPEGLQLEAVHKQAELVAKVAVVLALALIALHVFTLRTAGDDDDDEAVAPLPPGPSE